MSDDDEELARLDAQIAGYDVSDAPDARWRAADAVHQKGGILERRDGPAAALPLYAEVVRRLEGCCDQDERQLLICALLDIAIVHNGLGQAAESRSVAEGLLEEHFEDPPAEAIDVVMSAALLVANLLDDAGEVDRALELLDRTVERHGRSDVPELAMMAVKLNSSAAWLLGWAGRLDESIRRYDAVIDALGDPHEPETRRMLAGVLAKQAWFQYQAHRKVDGDARCRELLDRFGPAPEPEIAELVAWAREMLDHSRRYRPRRDDSGRSLRSRRPPRSRR